MPVADPIYPDLRHTDAGNRYTDVNLVGQGGLGRVYRAHHLPSDTDVAIKMTPLLTPNMRQRAEREIRVLGSLGDHPNVLSFRDSVITTTPPAIAMAFEWVDGTDLARLIEVAGAGMGDDVVASITRQACRGLAHIHARGLIHRDIKPSNIFVNKDGTVKIGDYGLLLEGDEEEDEFKTGVGTLVGTPMYMAPELVTVGRSAQSQGADVYAMGMTIFHLLAGHAVFDAGEGVAKLLVSIATGGLDTTLPDARASWRPLLESALATKPADRPGAGAMIETLDALWPATEDEDRARVRDAVAGAGDGAKAPSRRAPSPIIEDGAETKGSDDVGTMLQSLRREMTELLGTTVADLTVVLAQPSAPGVEARGEGLDARIDATFHAIRARLQLAWKLGLAMTITLFAVSVALIIGAVIVAIASKSTVIAGIFGGSGLVTLLGVLVWRPFDKIFFATIVLQQLEMIQVDYQRALSGNREERNAAFDATITRLDHLLGRVLSQQRDDLKLTTGTGG